MTNWRRLPSLALVLLLTACATPVTRVEAGAHAVGQHLVVNLDGSWNGLEFANLKPAQVWTMEGLFIDQLLIYADIKDGTRMHPNGDSSGRLKDVVFHSTMQADEVAAMFESLFTRDGSVFRLVKLAPYTFGGQPGFRFEFERTRRSDNVRLLGVAFGAIDRGQLYALVYQAPRLTFFPRHEQTVEAIAKAVTLVN